MSAADGTAGAQLEREREDRELMRRIESGSTGAFEELYNRYSARAYWIARSICRGNGGAEEAVQEAFLSVWRNRGGYRPERGTAAAWLLTIVRNRAIDAARRNGGHASRRAREEHLESVHAPGDVAEQAAARVDAAVLRDTLKALPNAQQEVITLAFYGQLTHTEIAAQLNLPPGTVKGRMRLGLNKLRTELDPVSA